jgi:DNA-binding response OmpR family regulator
MARRIAVIDDDPAFLELVHDLLEEEGYTPATFQAGMADISGVRDFRPDAIVLDLRMDAPHTGSEMLAAFQQDAVLSATPIIISSADTRQLQDNAASWESRGYRTLQKPFDLDTLLSLLEDVVGGPSTT